LLYELLSGRPPWSADNVSADIRSATPPPLTAASGVPLPGAIEALVVRMLDKDATRRPSAEAVVAALHEAGFAPGTAEIDPAMRRQAERAADDRIESVSAIRPAARRSAAPGASVAMDSDAGGLSPKLVGIGLAVLVVLLLGVVFVLPDRVPETRQAPVHEMPVVDEEGDDVRPPVVVDNEAANREAVYVDPEVRKRIKGETELPTRILAGDEQIRFSENRADYSGLDEEGRARFGAETTLGELLSGLEVLEGRGVEMWAPAEHRKARELYQKGDAAYLAKDFAYADELYLGALTVLEPLYERIEPTFQEAYAGAIAAFENGDRLEALRLYELAVAVTPTHQGALAGYERAKNLESVLRLVDQGMDYEEDLDLDAAQSSYQRALDLDPEWQAAKDGIERVQVTRTKLEFDTRMSEGFAAIAAGDFRAARAAFRVAQQLIPESNEPADGLLQVDQGLRLQDIATLENEARALQADEHSDAVVQTYEEILKVDNTLAFAADGLLHARRMSELHSRLDKLIAEPDRLSVPRVMQEATKLVVDITTREDIGPRLAGQRDELSRLLKRAATPLTVPMISDNATEVFVYKVGKMGHFMRKELRLRPGTYVVVGTRPGYRDVRMEFRVAPEIEMEPVVVQCEERI